LQPEWYANGDDALGTLGNEIAARSAVSLANTQAVLELAEKKVESYG